MTDWGLATNANGVNISHHTQMSKCNTTSVAYVQEKVFYCIYKSLWNFVLTSCCASVRCSVLMSLTLLFRSSICILITSFSHPSWIVPLLKSLHSTMAVIFCSASVWLPGMTLNCQNHISQAWLVFSLKMKIRCQDLIYFVRYVR